MFSCTRPLIANTSTKKNSKRKRRAEILTSSPYKKSLEEAAAKKVKKTKPKATRTQAKRKPKSKQTHGNDRIEINVEACSETDSWSWFMCEESYKEKMICCLDCANWVHVNCAGTYDDLFVCEICSDNIGYVVHSNAKNNIMMIDLSVSVILQCKERYNDD